MPELTLHPHAAGRCDAVRSLRASVHAAPDGMLVLTWRAAGDIRRLRVPPPQPPARADGLWRHTCFEVFVAGADGAYCELNFAPSSAWAAYRFAGYRSGMASLVGLRAPLVRTRVDAHRLEVQASLALAELRAGPQRATLRLALSAVIEEDSGRLSYWALAHPPGGRPDFHHPAGFALALPVPSAASPVA